jgi:glycosyltransferase involved in cell wall biosynthesis
MNLIVVNYSMSPKSLVFSHQRDTVIALSSFFDSVHVFTVETSSEPLPENIEVFELPWRIKSPLKNVWIILTTLYPFLIKNRDSIIFTHMTDIHAALISPLTWLLRIRHILWYAHANNSLYLNWASFFVSTIVSSTSGSCNLNFNKQKIVFINQGISHQDFEYTISISSKLKSILYYGRLDRSKNIHLFLELILRLGASNELYTLDVFGKSSNSVSEGYLAEILSSVKTNGLSNQIVFKGVLERKSIPKVSREYGIFLNLFSGSLDKTLIEATMLGLPVITWNREYCLEYGTWSKESVEETLDFLVREFSALRMMSPSELQGEIETRLKLAIANHSFDSWILRLVSVLKSEKAV